MEDLTTQDGGRRLERFKRAQADVRSGFEAALQEVRAGGKRGHWIWYVFPQLVGLGNSSMSQEYGIRDIDEAVHYLCDPMLGPRLLMITTAVADRTRQGDSIAALMNSWIDVKKLVSSLTLFRHVSARLYAESGSALHGDLSRVADEVLAVAAAEGYAECKTTLARLAKQA